MNCSINENELEQFLKKIIIRHMESLLLMV